jgi:ribosomal protein S18 acetylase RimI-like enzyme
MRLTSVVLVIAFLKLSFADVNPLMDQQYTASDVEILGSEPHEQDIVALTELLKASYQEFSQIISAEAWSEYEKVIVDVKSRMTSEIDQMILRDRSKNMLGCISLFSHAREEHMNVFPPRSSYVRLLAVHPTQRGKGLGKILVQACADRAKSQGQDYLVYAQPCIVNSSLILCPFSALQCLARFRFVDDRIFNGGRAQALHSGEYMRSARRLYEGMGFRRHGAADFVGSSGFPILAYILPLSA